jgi:hypothetical protein
MPFYRVKLLKFSIIIPVTIMVAAVIYSRVTCPLNNMQPLIAADVTPGAAGTIYAILMSILSTRTNRGGISK